MQIILLVGAKLQVIITKLGLRIQDRGDVVKGAPVVKPGDDLFWFGRPRFILFLIHLLLFQNAFQLAFFIWTTVSAVISGLYRVCIVLFIYFSNTFDLFCSTNSL